MQLDKQGNPPNMTCLQVFQPLHTGCLESESFLPTVVCQAKNKFENIVILLKETNNFLIYTEHTLDSSSEGNLV